MNYSIKLITVFFLCSFALMPLFSQEKESDQDETDLIEDFEGEEDLAKAAQNPIGIWFLHLSLHRTGKLHRVINGSCPLGLASVKYFA